MCNQGKCAGNNILRHWTLTEVCLNINSINANSIKALFLVHSLHNLPIAEKLTITTNNKQHKGETVYFINLNNIPEIFLANID